MEQRQGRGDSAKRAAGDVLRGWIELAHGKCDAQQRGPTQSQATNGSRAGDIYNLKNGSDENEATCAATANEYAVFGEEEERAVPLLACVCVST